jgi:chromosome partitioning protein
VATTVGFVSEKGGVGKTTACYHVAVALNHFHQKKILVVDGDYQRGGISGRFFPDVIETFGNEEITGTTLFHKFQQLYSAVPVTPDIDRRRWNNTIDVIVADPRLSTVSVDKLPSTNNIRANNLQLLRHLGVIGDVLRGFGNEYDHVLIDSHPEVSDVLRAIIFASYYIVSPVKLDRQSSIGVATVIAEMNNVNADVEMMRRGLQQDISHSDTIFAGTMGMMAREYNGLKQSEALEYNRLRRTGPIFDAYVTEGDGLRQAAAARLPVFDISGANAQKQARHFRELTAEFLQRCPQ